jgi:uncharacterized protein
MHSEGSLHADGGGSSRRGPAPTRPAARRPASGRGRAGLQLLDAGPSITPRMRGYCGGAAVDPSGTLLGVSCPRGGLAVFWDLGTSRLVGTVDLPDGCGLAPGESPGTFLLTSGRGGVLHVEPREDRSTPLESSFVTRARWDNHLAVARVGATPSPKRDSAPDTSGQ